MSKYEEHSEPPPEGAWPWLEPVLLDNLRGKPDLLDRLVAYLKAHRYVAHFHPADGRCVAMEPMQRPGDYHYLTLDELKQKLGSGA